jgi:putative methionine-R-sulfoxide reductase with GAF domain
MWIGRDSRISSYNRANMQTLGLSESTPRTESRWRALLWPTIRNEGDFDYITRQGFWICFLVAAATLVLGAFTGAPIAATFEACFSSWLGSESGNVAESPQFPLSPRICLMR